MQAAAAKSGDMDRETYKQIISLKTASLFEASAMLGAWLAGANESVIQALGDYAYNLGLTFQIVDDILDIIGDPEAMGKPVGLDLTQGRGVLSVAQNGGKNEEDGLTAVAELEEPDPIQQMMAGLRASGAVEIAKIQAQETAVRARKALEFVPDTPARDELFGLIEGVLNRDH
ncbi:MAG: polyprenyl synthetase family protein [Chloroflexi bacterium]|nr:polyprenyl synthetase family protein [Chloroflexota bacterium]